MTHQRMKNRRYKETKDYVDSDEREDYIQMLVRREGGRPNQRKNPNVNIVTMHTTTYQSMEEIKDDIKMDVWKMYYCVLSENA